MKYGFIPPQIVSEDYWLGSGKLGTQVINLTGDWTEFLPKFELQNQGNETNACVSFGTLSALEILHKFHFKKEINKSDRFLAKSSNTDPNVGNTPKQVSETLRKAGCVEEVDYPFVLDLQEFYKEIPQETKDLGLEWLKEFEWGYEWVDKDKIKEALKRSPVGVAVQAWQQNEKGEYIRLGASNHWVVLINFDKQDRPVIWDSYESGIKILEKEYELEYPQIYVLKKKIIIKENWFDKIIKWFRSIIKSNEIRLSY